MTDEADLERIEELMGKATSGPWQVDGVRTSSMKLGHHTRLHHIGPDGDSVAAVYFDMRTGRGLSDAHLIVAVINALPHLIARLRAAEAERDSAMASWRTVAEQRAREAEQLEAAEARIIALEDHGEFLLARLEQFAENQTSEDDARDYHGHVRPAAARLCNLLASRL